MARSGKQSSNGSSNNDYSKSQRSSTNNASTRRQNRTGGGTGGRDNSSDNNSLRSSATEAAAVALENARRSTGGGGSKKSSNKSNASADPTMVGPDLGPDQDHPDLVELEERLTEEVDDEFFQDPRKFHTLHRVIDVLGMQLVDDLGGGKAGSPGGGKKWQKLENNPAYRALKEQQDVVEEAIEHLALIHCADLNGSVVQVGRVARQFHDAVSQVRHLRKQVKEIQETLGASSSTSGQHHAGGMMNSTAATVHSGGTGRDAATVTSGGQQPPPSTPSASAAAHAAASSAMSLRELWLKKLECEAVLGLLEKLDTIRSAPLQFDHLLTQQNRIGAAVLCVSQALDIMFSSDVSQVQALHKIMEQLMMRKQRAEEVVFEVLFDVLFLRTGNGMAQMISLGGGERALLELTAGGSSSSGYNKRNSTLVRRISNAVAASGPGGSVNSGAIGDNSASAGGGGPGAGAGGATSGGQGGAGGGPDAAAGIGVNTSTLTSGTGTTTNTGGGGGNYNHNQYAAVASMIWNLPSSSWEYVYRQQSGMINPFLTEKLRFALDPDLQVDSPLLTLAQQHDVRNTEVLVDEDFYEDDDEDNVFFSTAGMHGRGFEGDHGGGGGGGSDEKKHDGIHTGSGNKAAVTTPGGSRSMATIPPSILEAEFDLDADERRSLEEQQYDSQGRRRQKSMHYTKPTFLDHVTALRTLVECLIRLRRLDDLERVVTEALERELSSLVQREQARTFLIVEKSSTNQLRKSGGGRYAMLLTKAGATTDLRDFRKHLNHILSAFGNVQVRLMHLTQIVRYRVATEKGSMPSFPDPSSALQNLLVNARTIMERELKTFLDAVLMESQTSMSNKDDLVLTNVSGQSRQIATRTGKKRSGAGGRESGLFSLGIIDKGDQEQDEANQWIASTTSSRRSAIQAFSTPKFVMEILFPKTTQNGSPQIRHALFFRKALAKWQRDNDLIRNQLARCTGEDTSSQSFMAQKEQPALDYLDIVIQKDLLPVLQEEAVNGTVQALERPDAFDPVLDRNVYARADSNEPQDVDMCKACTALYNFTGPLFLALHRLPKGGDMYLPLVAVLEHVILTFISRVKQQVSRICNNKTALQLLMDSTAMAGSDSKGKSQSFAQTMERRKAFAQLVLAYADGDLLEAVTDERTGELTGVPSIPAPSSDTPRNLSELANKVAGMEDLDLVGGVEREESNLSVELHFVKPYLEFAGMELAQIKVCSDEDLMKAACLAHSLLKLSSLLDSRLKVRSRMGITSTKTLTNTRALREAIKTIKANGLKMAKFCRADILLQSITRLSKVCNSSTIVARDAVRIPSSVNDLGEYMTAASDNLREAAGNAVTAYAFSTLEQYIPLCLIQTVRVLAAGKGVVAKAPLTMNGIEALDRSGSVLYRDLKGATSFDNSFWDIELAAVSFERSASLIAMMELEMPELEAYYQENRGDFSEPDFKLMFSMDGPRRKGDVGRYNMLVKRMDAAANK